MKKKNEQYKDKFKKLLLDKCISEDNQYNLYEYFNRINENVKNILSEYFNIENNILKNKDCLEKLFENEMIDSFHIGSLSKIKFLDYINLEKNKKLNDIKYKLQNFYSSLILTASDKKDINCKLNSHNSFESFDLLIQLKPYFQKYLMSN